MSNDQKLGHVAQVSRDGDGFSAILLPVLRIAHEHNDGHDHHEEQQERNVLRVQLSSHPFTAREVLECAAPGLTGIASRRDRPSTPGVERLGAAALLQPQAQP